MFILYPTVTEALAQSFQGPFTGTLPKHQPGVQRQLSLVSYFLELDHLEAPWQAVRHTTARRDTANPNHLGWGGSSKTPIIQSRNIKPPKEKLRLISGYELDELLQLHPGKGKHFCIKRVLFFQAGFDNLYQTDMSRRSRDIYFTLTNY